MNTVTTIDWRSIDWPRVRQSMYDVRHHYRYTYSEPISDLQQRLVMVPPDRHSDQSLMRSDVDVRGGPQGLSDISWSTDDFGNRVCLASLARVEHAADFEAHYRVQRWNGKPAPMLLSFAERARYLSPTALTAPDAALSSAAKQILDSPGSRVSQAERALEWAASAIAYKHGVTGVRTPAAMALHLGSGVCQDYAHIMISVLRLLGIPSRYVSGHLLGEGVAHAWVEAFLEREDDEGMFEVVSYDPTHRRRTGMNYITVAVGRDFADVTPTSGFFTGKATGRLSSSKSADIVMVEYDDGSVVAA